MCTFHVAYLSNNKECKFWNVFVQNVKCICSQRWVEWESAHVCPSCWRATIIDFPPGLKHWSIFTFVNILLISENLFSSVLEGGDYPVCLDSDALVSLTCFHWYKLTFVTTSSSSWRTSVVLDLREAAESAGIPVHNWSELLQFIKWQVITGVCWSAEITW